jgi:hypothetical protein
MNDLSLMIFKQQVPDKSAYIGRAFFVGTIHDGKKHLRNALQKTRNRRYL